MYKTSKTPVQSSGTKSPTRRVRVYHGYVQPFMNDVQTAEDWADFTAYEAAEFAAHVGAY